MPAEASEPAGGMTVLASSRRGGHVRRHAHNHGHQACRPLAAGLLLTAVASLQLVTPLLAERMLACEPLRLDVAACASVEAPTARQNGSAN